MTDRQVLVGRPEPRARCPRCDHAPFRSFLRGEVCNDLIPGIRRYAVICDRCKRVVGHEAVGGLEPYQVVGLALLGCVLLGILLDRFLLLFLATTGAAP